MEPYLKDRRCCPVCLTRKSQSRSRPRLRSRRSSARRSFSSRRCQSRPCAGLDWTHRLLSFRWCRSCRTVRQTAPWPPPWSEAGPCHIWRRRRRTVPAAAPSLPRARPGARRSWSASSATGGQPRVVRSWSTRATGSYTGASTSGSTGSRGRVVLGRERSMKRTRSGVQLTRWRQSPFG